MANKPAMRHLGDAKKEIVKGIQGMAYRHQAWQVFSDWVEMMAVSLSNACDWAHAKEREQRYLEMVKRYSKDEIDELCRMFGFLVEALEEEVQNSGPADILGEVYHALELHNKWKGQFFTPAHVCEFMGKVCNADDIIREKGYCTVCEPCVGSGAMVLGLAKGLKEDGLNYCKQMVVTATDVDLKCVHMAYVQFSLCGIPAVVIHGNTLTLEEWSRWYTPVYLMDGWLWRQSCGNLDKRYADDEALKQIQEPMYGAIREAIALTAEPEAIPKKEPEYKVTKTGQLSLF